jgi:predicted transcriptional regulator
MGILLYLQGLYNFLASNQRIVVYKDGSEKWIATDEGKKWIEKYYNIRDD